MLNSTPKTSAKPPVHALLLAGGRSKRMGRDKADLLYEGRTQLERTLELLAQLNIPASLSIRDGQSLPKSAVNAGVSPIYDHPDLQNIGPLGGMISALSELSGYALLVLACDLPFLDVATLKMLLAHREPTCLATAYRSSHDRLPEPLCAIWEPHCISYVSQSLQDGIRCPRKILIQGNTHLLSLPSPEALDNINTPDEYEEAVSRLQISK